MSKAKAKANANIINANPKKDFDLDKFNKEFVFKKELATVQNRIKSQEKIDRLTKEANREIVSLYNLSVIELIIGIKNTWFGVLDDLLAKKINRTTLTKNNRLFFIGLTIIIIAVIIYLYNFFANDENGNYENNNDNNKTTIIEKHYIYENNKQ